MINSHVFIKFGLFSQFFLDFSTNYRILWNRVPIQIVSYLEYNPAQKIPKINTVPIWIESRFELSPDLITWFFYT